MFILKIIMWILATEMKVLKIDMLFNILSLEI